MPNQIAKTNKYVISFISIIAISYLCILGYSCFSGSFFKVLSLGVLLSAAAFAVGGVLGFVFGLPTYKNENDSKMSYTRNTSLKDIADWITKIIIGITLFELKSIIRYFSSLVSDTSIYLDVGFSGIIFISTILIEFFFIGFVLIYLLTITEFFKFLASSDQEVNNIVKGLNIADDELKLTAVKGLDVPLDKIDGTNFNLSEDQKSKILNYVVQNGTKIDNLYFVKRLGKILFMLGEYAKSADFHNRAFELDSSDKAPKLNEAFIRSKYLKDTKGSNRILNNLIKKFPESGIPYYNIACNYNRELIDIDDNLAQEDNYVKSLNEKVKENLISAFKKDKALISEALKDKELENVAISEIFNEINGNNNEEIETNK